MNEKDSFQEGVNAPATLLTTKSVNTSVDALPGSLLVKLTPQSVALMSQGGSVDEMDALCAEYSAAYSNLFPCKGTALKRNTTLTDGMFLGLMSL